MARSPAVQYELRGFLHLCNKPQQSIAANLEKQYMELQEVHLQLLLSVLYYQKKEPEGRTERREER